MTKLGNICEDCFLTLKSGSYLVFLVLYVYKDMHYFSHVSMLSSSSVPANIFSWSYPAVTEHYKVFHASMRKSINQLVLRAHDTDRWHGSGFRRRSASSKLSVNMKKVWAYIISCIDLESRFFIVISFSNLLPAVITVVILLFILAFAAEFLTGTNTFKQELEVHLSMGLILTLHSFFLHILHTRTLKHSSRITIFTSNQLLFSS